MGDCGALTGPGGLRPVSRVTRRHVDLSRGRGRRSYQAAEVLWVKSAASGGQGGPCHRLCSLTADAEGSSACGILTRNQYVWGKGAGSKIGPIETLHWEAGPAKPRPTLLGAEACM